MSAELPPDPNQLDPSQLDPSLQGPAVANLAQQQEKLSAEQLATSVQRVGEQHGSDGVRDYLDAVLSDTEGNVPAGEKQAALDLLANEQRRVLHERVVGAGETMTGRIRAGNERTEGTVVEKGKVTKRVTEGLIEEHRLAVGGTFRNGVDTRRARAAHEQLADPVRRVRKSLGGQEEVMEGWSRDNQDAVREFDRDSRKANDHERALAEAETVTDPAHEGEPKDISKVIEEAVKEDTATKLHESMLEAQTEGRDPKEAILKILLEDKPDDLTIAQIKAYRVFASRYETFGKIEVGKIKQATESAGRTLVSFMRRGSDGYGYARSIGEAQEVYRQQSQAVQKAVVETGSIAPQSQAVLRREREELEKLKRYIDAVEHQKANKPNEAK